MPREYPTAYLAKTFPTIVRALYKRNAEVKEIRDATVLEQGEDCEDVKLQTELLHLFEASQQMLNDSAQEAQLVFPVVGDFLNKTVQFHELHWSKLQAQRADLLEALRDVCDQASQGNSEAIVAEAALVTQIRKINEYGTKLDDARDRWLPDLSTAADIAADDVEKLWEEIQNDPLTLSRKTASFVSHVKAVSSKMYRCAHELLDVMSEVDAGEDYAAAILRIVRTRYPEALQIIKHVRDSTREKYNGASGGGK